MTMKKVGILNQAISEVVAGMGHMDQITIGDAGLPIPGNVRRIDLALRRGIPGFLETVEAVVSELQVEQVIVAAEMETVSPHILAGLRKILPDVKWQTVPHTEFKKLTANSRAGIRTGEFTPYANVILVAGVVF